MDHATTDRTGLEPPRDSLDAGSQRAGLTDEPVLVRLADGRQVAVPRDRLVRQQDGSYALSLPASEVETAQAGAREAPETVLTLPVLAEELQVQKRQVETGRTRITKTIREREEIVDEPLMREEVAIERVPIQRLLEGPPPAIRYEGDTMIIPLLEEVMVVEKRIMIKEELHVRRQQTTVHEPQHVTLRSEEVAIERVDPANPQDNRSAGLSGPQASGPSDHEVRNQPRREKDIEDSSRIV
jgi:uncharacterized protein (TIGR02271 family)